VLELGQDRCLEPLQLTTALETQLADAGPGIDLRERVKAMKGAVGLEAAATLLRLYPALAVLVDPAVLLTRLNMLKHVLPVSNESRLLQLCSKHKVVTRLLASPSSRIYVQVEVLRTLLNVMSAEKLLRMCARQPRLLLAEPAQLLFNARHLVQLEDLNHDWLETGADQDEDLEPEELLPETNADLDPRDDAAVSLLQDRTWDSVYRCFPEGISHLAPALRKNPQVLLAGPDEVWGAVEVINRMMSHVTGGMEMVDLEWSWLEGHHSGWHESDAVAWECDRDSARWKDAVDLCWRHPGALTADAGQLAESAEWLRSHGVQTCFDDDIVRTHATAQSASMAVPGHCVYRHPAYSVDPVSDLGTLHWLIGRGLIFSIRVSCLSA
jgi:hypothetical protein